ncbi:MAG: cation diffusion facilitator family transporter, partial [SAR324 cluster bacterium]|nr:cation diffusion facilitator family transporter [SAR324 cluster bacterium]
ERYGQTYKIQTDVMLSVAFLGLIVNFLSFKILHKNHNHSVNVRSAMFHVIGDILGSVGALVAGAIIYFTGYNTIDLWISGFITLLILFGATKILSDSIKIILDAYPQAVDQSTLQGFLLSHPGVEEICDLHVWGINSKDSILTAHLVVNSENQKPQFVTLLNQLLKEKFGIDHITIQLEEHSCGISH